MGMFLTPGTIVNGVTVLESMSSGGEGIVFKAKASDGRLVCLKQLAFCASDPNHKNSLERFNRQKSLIGKHHPYVAGTVACFIEKDLAYIVSELVPGVPLDRMLAHSKRLNLENAAPIVQCTLEGLQWLHNMEIVHRDIKPGNIIVNKEDGKIIARIIDMGIAFFAGKARLTHKGIVCSIGYAPVEALKGTDVSIDGRFDLYSLGILFFEMLSGRLPFETEDYEVLIDLMVKPYRPLLSNVMPDAPLAITKYIHHLMGFQPADRPKSAVEALSELNSILTRHEPVREPVTVKYDFPLPVRTPAETPKETPKGIPKATPKEAPKKTPSVHYTLKILSGPFTGRPLIIPEDGMALGRSMLNPEDRLISRLHFRVTRCGEKLLFNDSGTQNGLIYRERRLRQVNLCPGDQVTVGRTVLEYVDTRGGE